MSSQPLPAGTVIDTQNPWPGLCAFDESAQQFFVGRDAESAELLRLVGQAPLTVLFGKSGLGKTSLLQAGLFPRLRQQNILPIYVRLDVRERAEPLIEQAIKALRAEIGKHGVDAPAPRPGEGVWEYLHGRQVAWWSRKNQSLTPLFVFDQFEEVFTLGAGNAENIERLRLDLADLIENRIPAALARRIEGDGSAEHLDLRGQRYKVLLSFREDFLPEVEGWKGELPSLMRNRLRLLPMGADRALRVVSGRTAAGKTHELVGDETAREIVRFVAAVQTGNDADGRGRELRKAAAPTWEKLEIEPALLSLVCEGLNDKRKARGQATIDAALLEATGTAIIGDFYQRCVADVPDKTRRFVEDALITEGGFRNSYPLQDALDQGLLSEALLRQLVDRRLLRIDHQLGTDRVELIHDRLTDVVREHRDQERERSRARRQRRMWWAAGSLGLVLGAVGLLFFLLWQNAQRSEKRATRLLFEAVAGKLVVRSRAVLERQIPERADVGLLLSAAAHRVLAGNETYGGLRYALDATPITTLKLIALSESAWALSGDGLTAVTRKDKTLRVWDAASGQPRGAPLQAGEDRVHSAALSHDGRLLAAGTWTGQVMLWDTTTGQSVGKPMAEKGNTAKVVAISPDGRTVASGHGYGVLLLWDVASGQARSLQGHKLEINALAFSPDGGTLVSGGLDDNLHVWDTASGSPRLAPLSGHASSINALAVSSSGRMIASGGQDGSIRVWDATSGQALGPPLKGDKYWVSSLAFSPDGRTLSSGGAEDVVRLWDLSTWQPRGEPLRGHAGNVSIVAFRKGGELVSSGEDMTLRVWEAGSRPARELPLEGERLGFTKVALSPDGRILATGGADGSVRLWDASSGKLRSQREHGHESRVTSFAFNTDGSMLASGSHDGMVRIWQVATGEPGVQLPRVHKYPVESLAWRPDGNMLASGSYIDYLRLWDLAKGEPRGAPLEGHTAGVIALAFSPDGTRLASGSEDKTVRLWQVATGNAQGAPLTGHNGRITALSFSPDGKLLASGSADQTLRLWRLRGAESGGVASGVRLQGHDHVIASAGFDRSGFTLVSASADKTIRFWSVLEEQPRGGPLQGHGAEIRAVVFADDTTLVSADAYGTIRLWDAPAAWIHRVCEKVVRNLSLAEWKKHAGDFPYLEQCPGLPVPSD